MKNSPYINDLKKFGYLLGVLFPLLFGFLLPALGGHNYKLWTLMLGIPLLILGNFKPEYLTIPYKIWMRFGAILGWINSRIILGLIFLLVLIPTSFIMKIIGHDPLKRRKLFSKTYLEKNENRNIDLNKIF